MASSPNQSGREESRIQNSRVKWALAGKDNRDTMAEANVADFPLECPRCHILQKVHVATKGTGDSLTGGPPTIECVNCKNNFEMDLPNRIVGEPYLV